MNRREKNFAALVAAGFVIGLIISKFAFYFPESWLYDRRARLAPKTPSQNLIQIVEISSETIDALGRTPNVIDLARALSILSKHGPKGIVSLLNFDPRLFSKSEVELLMKATVGTQNILFTFDQGASEKSYDEPSLPAPLGHIQNAPASYPVDKVNFAQDGVSRRINIFGEGRPTATTVVAQWISKAKEPAEYRGSFEFLGSIQTLTRFYSNPSKPIAFEDLLSSNFDVEQLKGKIIAIGFARKNQVADFVPTPLDSRVIAMSKPLLFANMVETLARDQGYWRPHRWISQGLIVAASVAAAGITLLLSPSSAIIGIIALTVGIGLFSFAAFAAADLVFTTFHLFCGVFISYYFLLPYRLVQESRKSWEYQQKNKLLTEVERLKTNFLSMMSHDLKTPLARIQGMADMVLSKSDNLTNDQKEALKSIGASTDELTNFVSGILDLGRVESQEVKLHLQAKDINSLLEEALQKTEHSAKAKNIQIVKEFEPLFSTKIDSTLMRQVFINIIENAIKYSPENSKILISTEEARGHIQVQVADQGLGIPPEELPHIFSKFYRSHSVKNGPIKGSGLGLFLAKYFVELHKGRISVESVPQQGSTFTVDLPMN